MCPFHGNCPRKENVVLEVNVLVKIGLKIRQRLVQRLIGDACVARSRIAVAGFAHGTQCVPGRVVLVFHHGHWILYAAKRCWQNRLLLDNGRLHSCYVGKQNPLFFHHVCSQLRDQALKAGADLSQFGMLLLMNLASLLQQRN